MQMPDPKKLDESIDAFARSIAPKPDPKPLTQAELEALTALAWCRIRTMPACRECVGCALGRLIAEVERAQDDSLTRLRQLYQAYHQLAYWWELRHSCPCGARAESRDTHPHVPLCPTEDAIIFLREAGMPE